MIRRRGRPTLTKIEGQIIFLLKKGKPLSVNQIADKLGYGWHTVENRLNKLVQEDRIKEIRHQRIRLFFLE
jgi:DNA-binding MarR family transcriptional regulator